MSKEEEKPVGSEEEASASAAQAENNSSTGLDENVAGLLCYLLGIITGIVFILLEKENRFIRFHALQSIFTFGILFVLNIVLTALPVVGWVIGLLLAPISVILWIVLMIKAYQGKWFKLPVVGNMSEKQLNKTKNESVS